MFIMRAEERLEVGVHLELCQTAVVMSGCMSESMDGMNPLSIMDGRQLDWSLSGLASPNGGAEIDRDVMDQQLWAPISGSPFYSMVKTAD